MGGKPILSSFYKKFFILMIPMALKELISALVNLIDTIMVGRLGETAIASVGIANQVYFLFTVFLFGVCCGAGVFAAQYWGAKDIKKMKSVLGINIILATIIAFVFMAAAWGIPKTIFGLFEASPEVAALGTRYIKIVCIGYIATAITCAYDMSVCCSQNASLPFLSRSVGLVVNIFLNWVLIFGNLGAPALGVPGAAIATVIARFSELGVMMIAIYAKKLVQAAKPRELFSFTRSMLVNYFKGATPVIINEMAWAIGATLYTWVFAKTSVQAMVIMTIVQNVERLLLVFFHGGGNAGGIIIGNAVGAGKNESAYIYAKKLCFLSVATGLVISMIFIFCRPLILSMYNITPEVYAQTNQILLIMAILMNLKALSFFLIVGVFRNGGDVKASLIIDVGSVWLVGVPLVLLTGLVLNLPLIIVYSMLCVEEIVRITISLKRFKSKKWIRNLVST